LLTIYFSYNKKIIHGEWIPKKQLHAEWLNYLNRENKTNFDQIKNYYMSRRLKRSIQVNRKILEKKNDFIIVNSEEDFNKEILQRPMKTIHYLTESKDNKNHLKWQKSSGKISSLSEYLIEQDGGEESIDEENFFYEYNENILIISAEPGMGKSAILDHFTHNSNSENFFVKIVLNNATKQLKDLKEGKSKFFQHEALEFILKNLLHKKKEQEISLLKHLAKEEKLILMFDGLDEVNEYKEQVKNLVEALSNDCKLKNILITTRNHLKRELEDNFKTLSFNLNNFDEEDQKNFLFKYWNNFEIKKFVNNKNELMKLAELLLKKLKSSLPKEISQIIGIPLQTKMIADIFLPKLNFEEENFANFEISNIADLYDEFIENKLIIQFEEKNNRDISREKPQKFQREKNLFYVDHIKLSSKIILEKSEISLELAEEEIIEYGVIVNFTDKTPNFLHQSFAEFFLAKSSLQKILEQNKETDDNVDLEQILRDQRHFLIRRFLNDLLIRIEIKRISKANFINSCDYKSEIENCCRENLIFLLKYFLEQKQVNLKSENEFLTLASREGHYEIVEFLIEKEIDVNQQNDDGQNGLHYASRRGHSKIVKLLIEKGIDVNKLRKEDGYNALHIASEEGYEEIVSILLSQKIIEINKQNAFGQTALHLASSSGHTNIVKLLIEKGFDAYLQDNNGRKPLEAAIESGHKKIVKFFIDIRMDINHQNKMGRYAIHVASIYGQKQIVELLIEQKELNINQQNENGFSALHLAAQNGRREIVELLVEKGIDIYQQSNEGYNALHFASETGHKEIVLFLLEKGIDINQQLRDGRNALQIASTAGNKEMVELLIERGSDINRQSCSGYNALHYASEQARKEIVELLIEKGIDIYRQTNDGKNALNLATKYGHKEIIQILLNKGVSNDHQETNTDHIK
jgi:ankyrin repeat protein